MRSGIVINPNHPSENILKCARGNDLSCVLLDDDQLSPSDFLSVCGKLVGHYPVCGGCVSLAVMRKGVVKEFDGQIKWPKKP